MAAPLAPVRTPARRWLRFSLRALLVLMTLAGAALGWLGLQIETARREQAAIDELSGIRAITIINIATSPTAIIGRWAPRRRRRSGCAALWPGSRSRASCT